jgi:F-type H+-transporting ATPase subunit a
MAEHAPDPVEHVGDSSVWEFFSTTFSSPVEWKLPVIDLGFHKFQITKFMLLELLAAILILAIFLPLSRRAAGGDLPRGRWWNFFEAFLTFVRNQIARPNLGEREADRYVPFLWTLFLFVLFLNLLGLIPFLGSPTANMAVTGALALCSFIVMHGAAIVKQAGAPPGGHGHGHGHEGHGHAEPAGHGHEAEAAPQPPGFLHNLLNLPLGIYRYFASLWPHIDVPYVGWFFSLMIFIIEFLGTFIKSGVLAVRLFANMFAGHMVLVIILLFIYQAGVATGAHQNGPNFVWSAVTLVSVLSVVALNLLELFVALLQAYIFTFLTALFLGMSLHPQH